MPGYRNCVRLGGLVVLLALGMGVHAQQLPPQVIAPAGQLAELTRQDEQMRQAGWEVMYMMDFGQMGDIWDMASQTMQKMVPRETFVGQVVASRIRLGALLERGRPLITRSRSDGSTGVPAGLYINVVSSARFTNQAEPVQDMVTFRFDEDRIWRVTGYSLQ